jgi:hypothetical protein
MERRQASPSKPLLTLGLALVGSSMVALAARLARKRR